jgi:hypothetical protein
MNEAHLAVDELVVNDLRHPRTLHDSLTIYHPRVALAIDALQLLHDVRIKAIKIVAQLGEDATERFRDLCARPPDPGGSRRLCSLVTGAPAGPRLQDAEGQREVRGAALRP